MWTMRFVRDIVDYRFLEPIVRFVLVILYKENLNTPLIFF